MKVITASAAFLVVFGAVLLWSGARRLFGLGSDAKKGEALVWGSVGLVLGAAMLAAGIYMVVILYSKNTSTR